jgi:multicomponent Na+:H+ antiporter subunit E
MIKVFRKILIKPFRLAWFVLFYLVELFLANLRVAHDVLRPHHRMKPGIIAIPLDAKSDLEIMALTNLITMTPGTLSLDISTDRRMLYIHAMYIDDLEGLRLEIKDGLEKKVMEVFG